MMRSQRSSSSSSSSSGNGGGSSSSASPPPTLPARARSLWRCCCSLPASLSRSLCASGPRSFLLLSLWALLLVTVLLALTLPPRLRATRYSALDQTTDGVRSARLLRAHSRRIAAARRSLSLLLTQAHLQQQDADAADPGTLSHADVWGDEEWQHHAPPEYALPATIAEGVLRNWAPIEGVTEPWPDDITDAATPAALAANSGVGAAAAATTAASASSSSLALSASARARARVLAGARLGYPPHWTPHTSVREQQLYNYTADLCVVVATVPRSQAYFIQTVASLLHALSPRMQQQTHVYVYNGATPHTSHADVMWLEAELERARSSAAAAAAAASSASGSASASASTSVSASPPTELWPHLTVLHGSERRARRAEELRRLLPSGSSARARVESHSFHSFSPAAAAGWHHRETMDYTEALGVCAQHQQLRARGLRGVELRAAMRAGDADPLLRMAADPEAARRDAEAGWPGDASQSKPPTALPSSHPRRAASQPTPPPPLALVLEDDVVLSHDFARRLYRALRPLWEPRPQAALLPAALADSLPRGLRHAPWGDSNPALPAGLKVRRGASPPSWAMVRIFLTDYWDGWEAEDGARIIAPAAALFGAAATLLAVAADWLRRAARKWLRERRRAAARWAAAAAAVGGKGVEMTPLRPGDRDRDQNHDHDRDVENGLGDASTFAASAAPSLPVARPRSRSSSTSRGSSSPSSPASPSLASLRDLEAQSAARSPTAATLWRHSDHADHSDSFSPRPFAVPSFLSLLRATPFLFPPPPAAVDTDAPSADSSAPPPFPPPPSAIEGGGGGGGCGCPWALRRLCARGLPLLLSSLLWAALGAALLLAVGKQNLGAFGGGALPALLGARSHSAGLRVLDAESGAAAGTLGVVYPSAALPHLLHFVAAELDGPQRDDFRRLGVDDVVNRWARAAGRPMLHAAPDLVQHVGAFSSAATKNQGNFDSMKTSPSFVP